ncbi:hypothetical protein [Chelativorans sp. J32]|uniref:hypothetical protein n=1 Tax=Chelativorans sp. J32 TaxID=935840 RepID=UPI0018DBF019|nr:hypothetical protein [Chelativorans sp. J32]
MTAGQIDDVLRKDRGLIELAVPSRTDDRRSLIGISVLLCCKKEERRRNGGINAIPVDVGGQGVCDTSGTLPSCQDLLGGAGDKRRSPAMLRVHD